MTTFLDTIESYEDQLLELVKKSQKPIVEYVGKGVELIDGRLPEVTYPKGLPTPIEVVQSQVRFTKKLIDANAAVMTAVLETVAPVAGYAKPKRAAKASTAVKAA